MSIASKHDKDPSDAQITHEQMKAAIEDTIHDYFSSSKIKQVRDIGDGLCYEFIANVFEKLGIQDGEKGVMTVRTEDFDCEEWYADIQMLRDMNEPIPDDIPISDLAELIGQASHEWLKLDSLYYDATAPNGVSHFLELPFFADQINGLREELASNAQTNMATMK